MRKNKGTIIITGAGSGIGRATAIKMIGEGYSVGLIGRSVGALQETNDIIRKKTSNVAYFVVDVRDKYELENAIKYFISKFGDNIIGVVAAAGIGGSNEYGEDDRWNEVIETNLFGTYFTFSSVIRHMKNDKKPKQLIAISSLLAKIGVKNYTAYCSSKAGILGLVRSLAIGLADRGIRVNAICPGWVDTKMSQNSIMKRAEENNTTFEDEMKKAIDIVPLKRMSSPEEMADLVSFLFEDGGSSFTGQSFDISNGSWMP